MFVILMCRHGLAVHASQRIVTLEQAGVNSFMHGLPPFVLMDHIPGVLTCIKRNSL